MLTTLRYYRLNLRLWLDDHGAPLVILGMLLVVMGLVQLGRALLPARATVIISATATPALQLLPSPSPAAGDGLPRAVTAYTAPGGEVLGAIEPGRPYTIVARAGSAWLQLSVQDSGLVWVRWAESGLVPAGELADLTPLAPPAPAVIVVERPAQIRTVYVQATAQPAAPPPPPPADTAPEKIVLSNSDGAGTRSGGSWEAGAGAQTLAMPADSQSTFYRTQDGGGTRSGASWGP